MELSLASIGLCLRRLLLSPFVHVAALTASTIPYLFGNLHKCITIVEYLIISNILLIGIGMFGFILEGVASGKLQSLVSILFIPIFLFPLAYAVMTAGSFWIYNRFFAAPSNSSTTLVIGLSAVEIIFKLFGIELMPVK